ncbi:hypothetical protein KIPE111705_27600 [Kibdelosporangium persicum]
MSILDGTRIPVGPVRAAPGRHHQRLSPTVDIRVTGVGLRLDRGTASRGIGGKPRRARRMRTGPPDSPLVDHVRIGYLRQEDSNQLQCAKETQWTCGRYATC